MASELFTQAGITGVRIVADSVSLSAAERGAADVILTPPALRVDGGALRAGRWAYPPVFKGDRVWAAGFDSKTSEIFSVWGKATGKLQATRTAVAVNASGRPIAVQAELEVMSKYRVKMTREKYQSEPEADRMDIDTPPAATGFQPMLARVFADQMASSKPLKFPALIQPKIDGVRCLIVVCHGKQSYLSRLGNDKFQHFERLFHSEVDHAAREIRAAITAHVGKAESEACIVLDGELALPAPGRARGRAPGPLPDTVSVVNRVKAGGEHPRESELVYYLYNFFVPTSPGLPAETRLDAVGRVPLTRSVWPLRAAFVDSPAEAEAALVRTVEAGFEGVMVHDSERPYEAGKRSSGLLKYKRFFDEEALIVGVEPGAGRESGAAILVVEIAGTGGKTTRLRPTGSVDGMRAEMLADPDSVIGKIVTYRYFEKTKTGMPRDGTFVAIRDYE